MEVLHAMLRETMQTEANVSYFFILFISVVCYNFIVFYCNPLIRNIVSPIRNRYLWLCMWVIFSNSCYIHNLLEQILSCLLEYLCILTSVGITRNSLQKCQRYYEEDKIKKK